MYSEMMGTDFEHNFVFLQRVSLQEESANVMAETAMYPIESIHVLFKFGPNLAEQVAVEGFKTLK